MKTRYENSAFTLIELVVVIAVIGMVLTGVMVGRGARSESAASRVGLEIVESMTNLARRSALQTGRESALVVASDVRKPTHFLRALRIASRPTAESAMGWVGQGEWIALPASMAVVPPAPSRTLSETGEDLGDVGSSVLSPDTCDGEEVLVIRFDGLGKLVGVAGQCVLAEAVMLPPGGEFPILLGRRASTVGLQISADGQVGPLWKVGGDGN